MSINRTDLMNMYQVDGNGRIPIKSIKDNEIRIFAELCDTGVNPKEGANDLTAKDGYLELDEIYKFIKKYDSNFTKTLENSVYDEQKDERGNLISRTYMLNAENNMQQLHYTYNNGKVKTCSMTSFNEDNSVKINYAMNFEENNYIKTKNGYKYCYDLPSEHEYIYRRIGEGKPVTFKSPLHELYYRLTNNDWELKP